MYKELYDEEHRIYRVNFKDFWKYQKPPTGEYDKDILCVDCDSKILGSQYDDYAAKVFEQDGFVQISPGKAGELLTIDIANIDYTKFKLFLLSLLWRASISKREPFNAVRLGPYQEIIRAMLYDRNPGDSHDFPCYMIALRHEIEMTKQLISAFRKDKLGRYTTYSIIICGFLYIYKVGINIKLPNEFSEILLSKSNQMKIVQMPPINGKKFIKNFLKIGPR